MKISDRLEAATKIYCCNILMTGEFYDLLSDHMKVGLRLVDFITLKGAHRRSRGGRQRRHARATLACLLREQRLSQPRVPFCVRFR